MCGINGILRLSDDAPPIDRDELLATRDQMARRGPDGEGLWLSPDGRIGLAHRRLAILDLSAAGAQPMVSACGRYRITYNGEIYNFRQLRADLEAEGWSLRSTSDTEVLLALYSRHGVDMLPLLRGMYAFALWDAEARRLLLARDPLGIKPLYYSTDGGCLRFASQVKALEAGGALSSEVDLAGLAGFLLWGTVPEPFTIRRAIRALPAGHFLSVEQGAVGAPVAHHRFDDETTAAEPGAAIDESVAAHLVSDVPVAVFLSAGLDSTLIAALASRRLDEPLTTFTLSFDVTAGTPLDEAPLAAEVARTLGTRHLEQRVGTSDFTALWPEALAAMDQPSIDGINVFTVSRAAHEAGIKVALTGLGGDELFGSYPSFADVPRWARLSRWGRRLPGSRAVWPALARRAAPNRPKLAGLLRWGHSLAGAYFLRRGLFLPEELPGLLGREQSAEALAAYDPCTDAAEALSAGMTSDRVPDDATAWHAIHLMETTQYMKNQLLRDADWASMAHSLELRTPLADARLRTQLAASGFTGVRDVGKVELVRRVAPELPAALFQRPKSGFYIPVPEWLGSGRPGDTPESRAIGSRQLARRVLEEVGVELGHG